MTHIEIECNCGVREISWGSVSKKQFIRDNYFVECSECDFRCKILSVKNDREIKIEKLLDKIKED